MDLIAFLVYDECHPESRINLNRLFKWSYNTNYLRVAKINYKFSESLT